MTDSKYRTSPDPNETGWPKGVPYIIGNEGCERFSFYGMKSILQVHLTILFAISLGLEDSYEAARQLIQTDADSGGVVTEAAKSHAQHVVHLFIAGVYALPMIGAIIADRFWGKYNTIISLSLVYCAGHGVLAVGENSLMGMYLGLGLIAIGSGGIKPCVSANVGDQFGKGNWYLVEKVFQAFYFIINFGSFFATLMIPWMRVEFGTSVAFAVPGILMLLATIVFWMGRNKFVHVPPKPGGRLGALDTLSSTFLFMTIGSLFFTAGQSLPIILGVSAANLAIGFLLFFYRQRLEEDDAFLAVMFYSIKTWLSGDSKKDMVVAETSEFGHGKSSFFASAAKKFGEKTVEGPVAVLRIISVFLLVSVFWALFDQHASSWIRQAQSMNLTFNLPFFGEKDVLPEQVQALNPLLVMLLIPFVSFFLYPTITKMGFKMTPLRRMSIGMFVAAGAYVTVALIQAQIDVGEPKSVHVAWQLVPYVIMTLAEVMVSITGLEFAYSQAPTRMKSTIMGFWLLTVALGNVLVAFLSTFEGLSLQKFFWVFAALMAVAALLFSFRAKFYTTREYSQ